MDLSQQEYMKKVNENLFGYSDIESYKELLNLLISLRSPKLSKDFKPTVIYEILKDSLTTLSDDDLRTITILFYFEDLKYKDIAKVLGIKEGTVKSRLSRAKERLFTMLKEEFHG